IFNQKTHEFEFRPGPIMAQVVLADEINRATPKTQSSLLECMEERQATIDGTTHKMPDPFIVIATQNPIEYEGTFALPAAQLGRDYVIPDDVKLLAEPALAHRLIIKTSSTIHDVQPGQVVRELLDTTAVEGIHPQGREASPRQLRTARVGEPDSAGVGRDAGA